MEIVGQHGVETAGPFGFMGDAALLRVSTKKGFTLEGKPGHRVWSKVSGDWGWAHIENLKAGDAVQLRARDNLWGQGSLSQDQLAQLVSLAPNMLELPLSVRTASGNFVYTFLTTLFSAPGTSFTFGGEQAAIDTQVMLLNAGWLSSRQSCTVKLETVADGLFDDVIVDIFQLSVQATYDINVPGTNTVVTNGIVSHNSDVRIKHTSRSLSAAPFSPKPDKEKDYNETERSIEFKGKDVYRYVALKAIKNKLWTPNRQVFMRLWVEDGSGTARGIDPVFDTIYYLQLTGQLTGNRKKFKLTLNGLGEAKKPVTWEDLKRWVLGDKSAMTAISTSLGYKAMSLRSFCFKQIKDGSGEELYLAYINGKQKNDDSEEAEDSE